MVEQTFPPGWDRERVERLIAQYDAISDDELIAEDEAAMSDGNGQSVVTVPSKLLPAIRKLIAASDKSA